MEEKLQFIEQFANETVKKYQEMSNHQQIDELKERNHQLENVSSQTEINHHILCGFWLIFILFPQKINQLKDVNKENEKSIIELRDKIHSPANERTPLKSNRNISSNTPRTPKTPKTPLAFASRKENQSPVTTVLSPLRV